MGAVCHLEFFAPFKPSVLEPGLKGSGKKLKLSEKKILSSDLKELTKVT